MKTKPVLILLAILILGFFLRTPNLTSNPTGFFCDEASIGYNAYTLATTGADEYKIPIPILFRAFGEYKNPVFIYSTSVFVSLFGLSEHTVRATAAFYSLLTVILFYYLGSTLFSRKIGLIASFLLSILPWHIHISRIGFDLSSSVFWTTFFCLFLWKSLKNSRFFPISFLGFLMTFFSYNSPKLYSPLILIAFFIINNHLVYRFVKDKMLRLCGIIFIILCIILIGPLLADKTIFARWNQFSHEKLTSEAIILGYSNHFSLEFLFSKGDIDFPG